MTRTGTGLRAAVHAVRSKGPTFMALCALSGVAVLAVFPAQAYMAQRAHRVTLAAELATLSGQNRALANRARVLETDGEVERLARLQYNLVRPGEEAYSLLPLADAPPAPAAPAPVSRTEVDGPWWQRIWARATSIF
ncbi:MAG: FtsB family cell division protein [Acidimicrobiales bacterium]